MTEHPRFPALHLQIPDSSSSLLQTPTMTYSKYCVRVVQGRVSSCEYCVCGLLWRTLKLFSCTLLSFSSFPRNCGVIIVFLYGIFHTRCFHGVTEGKSKLLIDCRVEPSALPAPNKRNCFPSLLNVVIGWQPIVSKPNSVDSPFNISCAGWSKLYFQEVRGQGLLNTPASTRDNKEGLSGRSWGWGDGAI